MGDFLTDYEVQALLEEPKRLPEEYLGRLRLKPKRGHTEAELDVQGDGGSEFRVVIRRSNLNHLDFSVILVYRVPGSTRVLRLKRYNGKSHQHTNPLENQKFYDFHIHTATERTSEPATVRTPLRR